MFLSVSNIFEIPLHTTIRFDLDRPNSVWKHVRGGTCFNKGTRAIPISKLRDCSSSDMFRTSYIYLHGMTRSNQFFHGDQTKWEVIFYTVDHAPAPATFCDKCWLAVYSRWLTFMSCSLKYEKVTANCWGKAFCGWVNIDKRTSHRISKASVHSVANWHEHMPWALTVTHQ